MRARMLLLLMPLLLGAQCPSADYDDRWVIVDVLASQTEGPDVPPAQTQLVSVRFHHETAAHDLDLAAGVNVEIKLA